MNVQDVPLPKDVSSSVVSSNSCNLQGLDPR